MNKKEIAFGIGIALTVLAVFTASAAADNVVYFDPDPSCAAPGETITVTLWLNHSDGVAAFDDDIHFDPSVVNITDATPGIMPEMWLFVHYGTYVIIGGWSSDYHDVPPGLHVLANLTFVANESGTSTLHHGNRCLGNEYGQNLPNQVWNDGTFKCPCGVPEDINVTIAETNVWGTVSNNHTYTHEPDDNDYESITEISRQGTSLLEHKWTIDVIGGTKTNVTFHLKANRTLAGSTDSDNFTFEYSRDGSTYRPLVTVDTPEDMMYSCMMPNETSGNVTIRVRDTDREKRHKDLDTISIDHMFIRSVLGEPMPDLVITEKSETLGDGTFTVTYTVENTGNDDAGASNTTIYIDGANVLEDPVPALNASDNYTNTVGPFNCPCGETLNVTVCADNGDVVDESDENNNCMENELTCPGGELLPDLEITDIRCVKGNGNNYYIYYDIKNNGTGIAVESVSNLTVDGEPQKKKDSVDSLGPGDSSIGEKFTYRGSKPTTIKVCADYEDLIAESDDTDNCRTEP